MSLSSNLHLLSIIQISIGRKMQQAKHQQESNDAQLKLLELSPDDPMVKISHLNANNIERISEVSRQRLSRRNSMEMKQISKLGFNIDMQMQGQDDRTFEFQDKLNLDMLIQQLLRVLTKTKIELMELEEPGLIKDNAKTNNFINYFKQQLKKYNKTLLLRQSQLGSLVFVIQNNKKPDFKYKYISTYGQIQKFIIPLSSCNKPINTVILEQSIQTEINFLQQYMDMITLLKLNIVHKKYLSNMQSLIHTSNRLKIINSKIATIAEMFPHVCTFDIHDLFSYKKTGQRWHSLLESSIRYKIYGAKEVVAASFVSLKNGINFVNATMSIMHKTREQWAGTAKDFTKDLSNLAQSTGKILKCLIFKDRAHHQAQVLISDPNDELAKKIWNLPQQKMFRNVIASVLPSIAFSQQFWIPRLFSEYIERKGAIQLPEIIIKDIKNYRIKLLQFGEPKDKIQMRINSPFQLSAPQGHKQPQPNSIGILGMLVKTFVQQKSLHFPTQVIFHIHGGGFISMSSFIHQTYTRIWANNLQVPIISVDYGKAPQYPFPHGLYDCFQAYMWILYCYRQVYDAQPIKIILVGDSAGGNLVAALTNMLIMFGLRVPDGVVLVYPALNLCDNFYTPSLLTSLTDLILPHTFLKICLKAYLKEGVNPKDPFVSPIFASDQVLKKYPPTRIFVGSKDPFHDDCCRLTQKLNKLQQGKAKLMIFDEFPHGFLQFDMKTQPHEESRKATKEVEIAIGELLERQ